MNRHLSLTMRHRFAATNYHDMRATGTPVHFVIFPVTGHFPSDPVRVEDVYRRWEAWLAKYL